MGKPFADPEEAKRHKKLEWLESGERGEIERNFGVGKRRYSLDCIVTKLKETSEVMIHSIVVYMLPAEEAPASFALFFQLAPNGDSKLAERG